MEIRPNSTSNWGAPVAVPREPTQPASPAIAVRAPVVQANPAGAPQRAAVAPTEQELTQALKRINQALPNNARGLEFSIDQDSERAVVKVIDTDTHEVIRQMPSREAIEIAKALDKLQSLLARQSA
jgi:flagellar protein FlaG